MFRTTPIAELYVLQTLCDEQESEIGRLSGRVEQLNEARSEQARQLAEARLRVQSISKERQGERERELRQLQDQQSHNKEIEQEVRVHYGCMVFSLQCVCYSLAHSEQQSSGYCRMLQQMALQGRQKGKLPVIMT